MILADLQDIIPILRYNPNGEYIAKAIEQRELLRMHCTGEGIESYVEELPEFMRDGQIDTLKKLMFGNADVISRVMAPRDKIYFAKGGIEQYNLPEIKEAEFRDFLSEIADGLPYKEWIRQKVQPLYDYDPNAIVFIEIDEYNNPYPTTKCITEIYDYEHSGRALEYVVFNVDNAQIAAYQSEGMLPAQLKTGTKIYRVVDDMSDRLVSCINKDAAKGYNIEFEMPNEFGYVPAIIVSDICGYSSEIFDSPLSRPIKLLDKLLMGDGLFNWTYWRMAMPKEWMQKFTCPTCDGDKQINGEDCPECKGTGILPFMRWGDVAINDWAKSAGENIPTPPMGIISPPVESLQFMKDENVSIEDKFSETIWGVAKVQSNHLINKASSKSGQVSNTAYEAQLNEQPKHDKLKVFGNWRDSIMKFIADTCGQYKYRQLYKGSAILCGDRFMIESPDATWDRYTKAVAAFAPMSILDSLLVEYIENKYNNNPLLYRKYYLLMQVEPFVHEQVGAIWIDQEIPLITRLQKKYFDEWTSTLTDYDISNIPDQGGAEILRGMLKKYVLTFYVQSVAENTLLLENSGEILDMGDEVQVIKGKEQKPEHAGKSYLVGGISGINVTLKNDEVDALFGYKMTDLYKTQTRHLPAAPIEDLYD